MAIFRNNGGTYATPKGIFRNNGGTYGAAKAVWRNSNGTWRQVWASLTVTIQVASHRQVRVGGTRSTTFYDEITFRVTASDGSTPSSYSWGGSVWGTASTAVFQGPQYDTNGWTYQDSGVAQVTVVIGGSAYSASYGFGFTTGDLM